jgi:hypothetical protein
MTDVYDYERYEPAPLIFHPPSNTKIPDLDKSVQDYIEAYRTLGLDTHANNLWYDARCDVASKVFQKLTEDDIVRLFAPDAKIIRSGYDDYTTDVDRFYDHLYKKTYRASNWLSKTFSPQIGFWTKMFHPELWWGEVRMTTVNKVNTPIPYKVLQTMIAITKLDFFNCFFAFVPKKSKFPISAVITASLSNGHYIYDNNRYASLGSAKFTHFFVAKW